MIHSVAAPRAVEDRCAVADPIWAADHSAVVDHCAAVDRCAVPVPIWAADRSAVADHSVVAVDPLVVVVVPDADFQILVQILVLRVVVEVAEAVVRRVVLKAVGVRTRCAVAP